MPDDSCSQIAASRERQLTTLCVLAMRGSPSVTFARDLANTEPNCVHSDFFDV
jgi:hypothetical protein